MPFEIGTASTLMSASNACPVLHWVGWGEILLHPLLKYGLLTSYSRVHPTAAVPGRLLSSCCSNGRTLLKVVLHEGIYPFLTRYLSVPLLKCRANKSSEKHLKQSLFPLYISIAAWHIPAEGVTSRPTKCFTANKNLIVYVTDTIST